MKLAYIHFSISKASPCEYSLLLTGRVGAPTNGRTTCPPCMCPESIRSTLPEKFTSAVSGLSASPLNKLSSRFYPVFHFFNHLLLPPPAGHGEHIYNIKSPHCSFRVYLVLCHNLSFSRSTLQEQAPQRALCFPSAMHNPAVAIVNTEIRKARSL